MVDYPRLQLRQELVVDKIVTFHYSELAKDYEHPAESHDFWEFLYMDKGEADIQTGGRTYRLKQGDLIFYTPNEFHSLRTGSRLAPNVMIICFHCDSAAMNYFKDKMFRLGDRERSILAVMLKEGRDAFDPPVDRPQGLYLQRRSPGVFGAEQLIKVHLEMLLIYLYRNGSEPFLERTLSSSAKEKRNATVAAQIIRYLEHNVPANPTLADIGRHFNMSPTKLKSCFKTDTGYTINEYHHLLKIEKAKKLIREADMTYTEIAEALGYSSIHYFSRDFKRVTDMTPSEYDKSLKARAIDNG